MNGDLVINGYTIGAGQPVFAEDVDIGVAEIRSNDTDASNGDRRYFGRDYFTAPIWTLRLVTNTDSADAALAAMESVATIWRDPAVRLEPDTDTELFYEIAGRVRKVYGRPRKLSYNPSFIEDGVMSAPAEFATSDALFYDTVKRALPPIRLVPESTGGFTVPFTAPIMTTASAEVQGTIGDVGGTAPTPFVARMHGPITNPLLYGNTWRLQFLGLTLLAGQWVTVDTRKHTAELSAGGSVAGLLTSDSRLARARLYPGSDRAVYGGIDPTGTSYAELEWYPAFNAF